MINSANHRPRTVGALFTIETFRHVFFVNSRSVLVRISATILGKSVDVCYWKSVGGKVACYAGNHKVKDLQIAE